MKWFLDTAIPYTVELLYGQLPVGGPRNDRARRTPQGAPRTSIAVARREPALNRKSLGDQIAQRLRDDILLGRIPPGTAINQQQLSEAYETSRIPVRDALRQLVHEGFLVSTPGGQPIVTKLTPDDIFDTFSVLALIHGRLARRATLTATAEELAGLETPP